MGPSTKDPAADLDARDEAFWRTQEARREKKMGQPCCTQSGMSWSMIDMPGQFAVVIHGEFDCVNCFHHHNGRSAARYYSTRLSEAEITNGETQEPLRKLLHLIAAETDAEAVIVLGTCPVEVIGDRFENVVEKVSEETGIPMIPLHTSGLAMLPQTKMLDWLYVTLASLPAIEGPDRSFSREAGLVGLDALFARGGVGAQRARLAELSASQRPPTTHRINLVGIPESRGVPEPVEVLGRAGLEINGIYPFGASLRDWRSIGSASTSFLVDASMFPRLRARLQNLGQATVDLPLPVGLISTKQFYRAILEQICAQSAEADAVLEPHCAPLESALADFRAHVGSRRMAVAVRMLNTYRSDQLAFEGLGDLSALLEMGFDVTLLIQGPPESDSSAAFKKKLAAQGLGALPFEIFPGPFALAEHLRRGAFELCYAADSSREAAREAGVPMISARGLAPFFEGVRSNLEQMRRMVFEAVGKGG